MLKLQYFGHLLWRADSLEMTWCWKDWRQEEKGATEDKMVERHHQLNGHESEQTPGDSKGQESLACCRPWGCKEVGVTYWLSNNKAFSNWRLLSDAPSDLDGQCMRKCRQITTSQKNRLWDCMWTHGRGETANQVCLLGNMDETAYSYKCNQRKLPSKIKTNRGLPLTWARRSRGKEYCLKLYKDLDNIPVISGQKRESWLLWSFWANINTG